MKKTIYKLLLTLGVAMLLVGCGGNGGSSDTNQTTTPPQGTQVLPICSIAKASPITSSKITLHAVCNGGNVVIDQATVTADGQLKNLNYTGVSIDDYTGFSNLQADTVYKVAMDVIVGGTTISKSVNVRTATAGTTPPPTTTPPTTPPVSSPTIAMASQTVNDNGGFVSTDLPLPTVTGVVAGAVYSLPTNPTGGMLTINASTGLATWNGNINPSASYNITIKVVNPDGGQSTVSFTLNVVDNL